MSMRSMVALVVLAVLGVGFAGWAGQSYGASVERAHVQATATAQAHVAGTATAVSVHNARATSTARAHMPVGGGGVGYFITSTATATPILTPEEGSMLSGRDGVVGVTPITPTAVPTVSQNNVHMCTEDDFSHTDYLCTQDDLYFNDIFRAYVELTAPSGRFGDRIIIMLEHLDVTGRPIYDGIDGTSFLGTLTRPGVRYGMSIASPESWSLDVVLHSMDSGPVSLEPSQQYRLIAQTINNDGSNPTMLGTFDFTYNPHS